MVVHRSVRYEITGEELIKAFGIWNKEIEGNPLDFKDVTEEPNAQGQAEYLLECVVKAKKDEK